MYKRQAETQADEDSGRFMMERYRTTRPLQDILARLEREVGGGEDGDGEPSVFDLLRSHPGTAQRIEHLKAIERDAQP